MVSTILNGSPIIQSESDNEVTIFIAGGYGIDWRERAVTHLTEITPDDIKIIIYDPTSDTKDITKRTKWENSAMDVCDIFGCYLSSSGIHPISLYELGKCNEMMANVILAVEKGYERSDEIINEVKINSLGNPKTKILTSANPESFADLLLVAVKDLLASRKEWNHMMDDLYGEITKEDNK